MKAHGNNKRVPNNMTPKPRKYCGVPKRVGGCLFGCNRMERVIRELDAMTAESIPHRDPIMEQLKQCPEAFKTGELVGKLFDRIKYEDDAPADERCLPPAGAVMPPLV
jgi:hypothetical protein